MAGAIEVRRKPLRHEPGPLLFYSFSVVVPAAGIVVALVVNGFTWAVVAGSVLAVAIVWPLWPMLVVRVAEDRRARLQVEDGELTIVDWRGRARRYDRSAIRAVHRYAVYEGSEGGSSRHERDLVEVEGARPVWITLAMWDPDAYHQVWPALGVAPADAQVLRFWAEAPQLDADQAGRERWAPCLFIVAWLVGSAALLGLGFYIAWATDTTI